MDTCRRYETEWTSRRTEKGIVRCTQECTVSVSTIELGGFQYRRGKGKEGRTKGEIGMRVLKTMSEKVEEREGGSKRGG